jgi:hypothetical protein
MIDNLFPCDMGALVTRQETIMRLRTIALISSLALGLLAAPLPAMLYRVHKEDHQKRGW